MALLVLQPASLVVICLLVRDSESAHTAEDEERAGPRSALSLWHAAAETDRQRLQSIPLFTGMLPAFVRRHTGPELAEIERLQHPAVRNCSRMKITVLPTTKDGGIGNALNRMALRFQTFVAKKRVTVMESSIKWDGWPWADSSPWCTKERRAGEDKRLLGFECFFLPLSSCTHYVQVHGCKNVFCNAVDSDRHADRANALRYFMRPNARLTAWLFREYVRFWSAVVAPTSREQLISVHIRWSDKIVEGDLHSVAEYLRRVLHIVARKRIEHPVVFLSSEDGSAITLFEEAVANEPRAAHIRVIKVNYHRMSMNCGGMNVSEALGAGGSGLDADRFHRQLANGSMPNHRGRQHNVVSRGNCATLETLRDSQQQQHAEDLTLISFLNLYLALESRHVVCLTASNWCWLLQRMADPETELQIGIRKQQATWGITTVVTDTTGGAFVKGM